MVALTPGGEIFTGAINGETTYCMTAREVGEVLAAAFVKTMESYTQALFVFALIALLVGFGIGVAFMYARQRIIDAESAEDPE